MTRAVSTIFVVVSILIFNSGCMATRRLARVGNYEITLWEVKEAYTYKNQLVFGYQGRTTTRGVLDRHKFAITYADCWAEVPIQTITATNWSPSSVSPLTAHRSPLPSQIPKDGEQIPIAKVIDSSRVESYEPTSPTTILTTGEGHRYLYFVIKQPDAHKTVIQLSPPYIKGNEPWAYPLIALGLPVTLSFDFVTFPFQLGPASKEIWNGDF